MQLLYVVAVAFAIALAIAWVVLPFAIIGTKDLLRDIRREQEKTNALLGKLTSALQRGELPVLTDSASH